MKNGKPLDRGKRRDDCVSRESTTPTSPSGPCPGITSTGYRFQGFGKILRLKIFGRECAEIACIALILVG